MKKKGERLLFHLSLGGKGEKEAIKTDPKKETAPPNAARGDAARGGLCFS